MAVESEKAKTTILIVDDEPETCEFLAHILERRGYCAEIAFDGQEALDKAKNRFFNILITDLRMPKVDGMTVLKEIKKLNPHVEVIIVTGYPTTALATESMKSGAFDFLTKPIDADKILSIVGACLERQRVSPAYAEESELRTLYKIGKDMEKMKDFDSICHLVFHSTLEMFKAQRGSFLLCDEEKKELRIKLAAGLSEEVIQNTAIKLGEGVCGKVVANGIPLLVENIEAVSGDSCTDAACYATKSFISTPIKSLSLFSQEGILGVLNIGDKHSGENFTEREKLLLSIIARQTALALENNRLRNRLQEINASVEFIREEREKIVSFLIEKEKNAVAAQLALELDQSVLSALVITLGLIDVLEKKNPEEIKGSLEKIRQLVTKTVSLIRPFLKFSRIYHFKPEKVSFSQIFSETLALLWFQAIQQQVQIKEEIPLKDLWVSGNAGLLSQACFTLLIAALAALPEGGTMSVSVGEQIGEESGEWRIGAKIVLSGEVAREEISQIIDPLGSLGKDYRPVDLRLSLVQMILKRHNGTVTINDNDPDRITLFLDLPAA